jgi:hypothetical protein
MTKVLPFIGTMSDPQTPILRMTFPRNGTNDVSLNDVSPNDHLVRLGLKRHLGKRRLGKCHLRGFRGNVVQGIAVVPLYY